MQRAQATRCGGVQLVVQRAAGMAPHKRNHERQYSKRCRTAGLAGVFAEGSRMASKEGGGEGRQAINFILLVSLHSLTHDAWFEESPDHHLSGI